MEAPVDLSLGSLERSSYRYLQQTAKSMGLPSNVKKASLIEMIHAKNYGTPEHFFSVVARVKQQRKLASRPRKNAKKKKRVQGSEISSTSIKSPPITTTPQPTFIPYTNTSQTIKKCSTSILNPLITKRALNTDRVLRSYNNKLRRNFRYSYMNVNNTVMGVIKAKNTVKSTIQERFCEWNVEEQQYRPVRQTIVQRRESQSIETENVVLQSRLRETEPCSSQLELPQFHNLKERHLVPVMRNSIPCPQPQRRLSGIYPLKPAEQTSYKSSLGTYRRHDGRISKERQRPAHIFKNKMTQTTFQRNVKPYVVPLKNAIRPNMNTIKGCNSNSSTETAEDSSNDNISVIKKPNSSELSSDRPTYMLNRKPGPTCYTRLMRNNLPIKNSVSSKHNEKQMTRRQTFDQVYVVEGHREHMMQNVNNRNVERDFSVPDRSKFQSTQRNIENVTVDVVENHVKRYREGLYVIETMGQNNNGCVIAGPNRRSSRAPYATDYQNSNGPFTIQNQNRQNSYSPYVVESQNRPQSLFTEEILRRRNSCDSYGIENETRQNLCDPYTMDNQTEQIISGQYENQNRRNSKDTYGIYNHNKQNNSDPYENQYRRNSRDPYGIYNHNRQNNCDPYAIENQTATANNDLYGFQRTRTRYASYATETQRYSNESHTDVFRNSMEERNFVSYPAMQGNVNHNNTMQNIYCNKQNRTNTSFIHVNQNPLAYQQRSENIERDYPNMYASTDVLPEDQFVTVTQASNAVSEDEMAVYYSHKKLQAECGRVQSLSKCVYTHPSDHQLPHISELFRHLQEPRINRFAQPLYIDVGDGNGRINGEVPQGPPLLETVYNYIGPTQAAPLGRMHIVRTTTNTSTVDCVSVVTTPTLLKPAAVATQYVTESYPRASCLHQNIVPEQVPRLQDYIRMAEQETDMTCDEVLQLSPLSSGPAPSSPLDATALSTEIEEALDMISQDGDFMDGISVPEGARCELCDWTGPCSMFYYHVKSHHAGSILVAERAGWSHAVSLGAARGGLSALAEHAGTLYVLRVLCRAASRLHARLTMLPKDMEAEIQPTYGRLTIYNKVTGEPFTWEGEISYTLSDDDETEPILLDLDQHGSKPEQNGLNKQNRDVHESRKSTNQSGPNLFNPDETGSPFEQNELNKQNSDFSASKWLDQCKAQNQAKDLNEGQTLDQTGSGYPDWDQNNVTQIYRSNNYSLDEVDQAIGLNLDQTSSNTLYLSESYSDGLNVDLSSLDLLPNSANLKLVNGEWVVKSDAKVVAGQPELDNIEIVIYVQILQNDE